MQEPKHIPFANQQNPNAELDLVELKELYKRSIPDHNPFSFHIVEFYIVMIITGGNGSHTIDFTKHKCKKGSLLTIRKDQIHKFDSKQNLKGYLLLFTENFLISYLEKLEALKSLRLFNDVLANPKVNLKNNDWLEISGLIERIKNEYFNLNDDYSQGIIRSELQILLSKLYRIKSRDVDIKQSPKYLEDFIRFQDLVEQHVHNTNKVKDYAAKLGLSTKTLNNITGNIINKSAKAFIDDICMKQIKRQLINTAHSIKEIAYYTGFEETTNFYKYFKRHTELTPEQFRERYR